MTNIRHLYPVFHQLGQCFASSGPSSIWDVISQKHHPVWTMVKNSGRQNPRYLAHQRLRATIIGKFYRPSVFIFLYDAEKKLEDGEHGISPPWKHLRGILALFLINISSCGYILSNLTLHLSKFAKADKHSPSKTMWHGIKA